MKKTIITASAFGLLLILMAAGLVNAATYQTSADGSPFETADHSDMQPLAGSTVHAMSAGTVMLLSAAKEEEKKRAAAAAETRQSARMLVADNKKTIAEKEREKQTASVKAAAKKETAVVLDAKTSKAAKAQTAKKPVAKKEPAKLKTSKKTSGQKSSSAAGASKITVNGTEHSYSNKLSIVATAYSAAASENGGWGAVDYFGNPLAVGTIAVDPNVIPLGTKVYVSGYNHAGLPSGGMIAYAKDTGGAIKGNRIDIFVPGTSQQVSTFGYQNVSVFILK
ncbi:3D domain-containing protein [Paenibacillus sp. NPDC058071]|uniref:3D domain-containing protein n=1 Tax=Paenibacillus sp. NPDC058071 TaxID=3346326 RepID=UPI0036DC1B20